MTTATKWKIAFFIIGLLALVYMVYATGIDAIWENVQKTGLWFIPILLIWLIVYIINTLAWRSIIKDRRTPKENIPSFLHFLRVTISGYAINYITPVVALGGEPYRILELKDTVGGKKATSGVLSYSMMHILSHVVFWMLSIILILCVLRPATGIIIGAAIVFAIFGFFLYMIFRGYRKGLIVKFFRILERIPLIKKPAKRFSENKLSALQEIDKNIVSLYTERRGTFYLALNLELLARVISCFEIFCIGQAIGLDMLLLDSIVLYAGSTLFANILFFSPMQLGTREGGLAITLSAMGFEATSGVFIGLVMRIRELIWIAIGVALMRFTNKKKKRDKNI
jgi:hypothetical protein